jgi:Zn-dependent protease with chaperone function
VPAGLDLPSVDPREFFSVAERGRAEAYARLVRWLFLLTQLTAIAVLAGYAAWGGRLARESAAGRIGTGMLLAMLGLGILWIVQLPFGLTELWWQRRHDISRVGYGEWILGTWFGLGGEFLFICFAILIVMGLAGPLPRWWWVPGGAVFVGLATLFALVLPYLIPQKTLDDRPLAAKAKEYEAELGLPDIPVRVQEVGTETTAPNAEAAGLGPTRRVILWDTLLDGRFRTDEVEVVLAHELGHHDREHVWKGIGWYALFAFPGAYLIARATRRRGGMREPQAVPLALLVLATLSFLALPAQNVITRHMEAEADWVALETTRDPESATGLFRRFTIAALADPDPPTWSYVLVESHPTIVQRIAMAEAWQRRAGR